MNNISLLDRLLNYYKISKDEYLALTAPISSSSFANGHNFKHINEAKALINETMKVKGKISIYGDYDADGIMGTSILVKMFHLLNYPVNYFIPSRYIDGYGLTLSYAKQAVEEGVNLLITVDNGVSQFIAIDYLKENGVKVLVLDHHEVSEKIVNADIILHPTYDKFGATPSSGAFVAFILSINMLGYFNRYLSTLASISLISDMMPLKEYNRELLRIVINEYKEHEFLQIDLLKEDEEFNEATIGMKIAPRINSIGRIKEDHSVNDLVKFFVSDNKDEILHYIDYIYDTNEERKNIVKDIKDDELVVDSDTPCIIYISDAKEGILGLIANNLVSKYKIPVVVLTHDKEKHFYKGSARAPIGFSLLEAFNYASSTLLAAGGHSSAGGCTVNEDKIDEFKSLFSEYCLSHPIEVIEKDNIELGLNELNRES